jgi:hypothetical protein
MPDRLYRWEQVNKTSWAGSAYRVTEMILNVSSTLRIREYIWVEYLLTMLLFLPANIDT